MNVLLFDCIPRASLQITGEDRAKFLHNFCTNNIKALAAGRGCEAFVANVKGRVLAHIFVFADADRLWIDTVPESEAPLIAHLERYLITEDVQIASVTPDWAAVMLFGPDVPAFAQQLWSVVLEREGDHSPVAIGGRDCRLRRIDWLGSPGIQLLTPAGALPEVRDSLLAAGAGLGDRETWESLRIAAGFPEYGRDITDEHLAQEVARTGRAISFTKGCYLGQEPIARIDALGHVNRQLRVLRSESADPPPPGTAILDPQNGSVIGEIRSSARDHSGGGTVALGYIRSHAAHPGTRVALQIGETPVTAIVEWPDHLTGA